MSKKKLPSLNFPAPNLETTKSIFKSKLVEANPEADEDQQRPGIPPRLYLLDADFTRGLEKISSTTAKIRESTGTRKKPITHRPRSSLISSRYRGKTSIRASRTNIPGHHPNTASRLIPPETSSNAESSMHGIATRPRPHYQPLVSRTAVENEEYTEVRHNRGAQFCSEGKLRERSLKSQEEYTDVQHNRGTNISGGERPVKCCTLPSNSEEQYMEVMTKHKIPAKARKEIRSCYGEPVSSFPTCKYEQEYAEVKERTVQERLREIKHADATHYDNKGDINTQLRARLENLLVSQPQQEESLYKEGKARYI